MKTVYTCFPEGKTKALSLSYDDGKTADRKLVDLLNRHGIKGTFHLNSGSLDRGGSVSAKEAAALYRGHEIAAHSFSHPTLDRCPKEQIAAQIIEDRKILEQIADYPVRGFSYPNGAWNNDLAAMLPHLGISYARRADTSGDFYMGDDFLKMMTTCHHDDNLAARTREFIQLAKPQFLFWFTVWGHSWEFEANDNWQVISSFCAEAGGLADVWYTTMIGMADYMAAAGRVCYSAAGDMAENPSARSVWITVDGKVIEIPGGRKIPL